MVLGVQNQPEILVQNRIFIIWKCDKNVSDKIILDHLWKEKDGHKNDANSDYEKKLWFLGIKF